MYIFLSISTHNFWYDAAILTILFLFERSYCVGNPVSISSGSKVGIFISMYIYFALF